MRFDIITIFPEFFSGPLEYGIVQRARQTRLIEAHVHDLRAFTRDRHRTVDDRPFGGGEGMVMKAEPIFEAVESLTAESGRTSGAREVTAEARTGKREELAIVLLSAAGRVFRQTTARRFAKLNQIVLICGRYEGVDERVAEHLATDEISIGDFVLSGGELPAALILDAVTRLIPGALGNEDSAVNESFSTEGVSERQAASEGRCLSPLLPLEFACGKRSRLDEPESDDPTCGILDYPHYTRPQTFRGWGVPEILMSGNHQEIRRWRQEKALEKTRRNRPDLVAAIGGTNSE